MSICVFGASVTWGACDFEKGGWANRLRLFLDNNNYDLRLYNLGVSGTTSTDVLDGFYAEAIKRKPEIIIFSLGDNDSSYRTGAGSNKVPIEMYRENIAELSTQAFKITNKVVFLGLRKVDETKTMPVSWNADAYYRNEYGDKYNSELKKVCLENSVGYIDLMDVINIQDLFDGLHPNSAGHEKIFLKVKEYLLNNKWIS